MCHRTKKNELLNAQMKSKNEALIYQSFQSILEALKLSEIINHTKGVHKSVQLGKNSCLDSPKRTHKVGSRKSAVSWFSSPGVDSGVVRVCVPR